MNFHNPISFSLNHSKSCSPPKIPTYPWQRFLQKDPNIFKSRIALFRYSQLGLQQSHSFRFSEAKKNKKKFGIVSLKDENVEISKKKGSFAGAVALIIGTSFGSGILALPKKTSPAGLIPSSISMTMCWAVLLIEALLLVEINVGLLRKKKAKLEDDELEVVSIRTMAQETLGEWGGSLATILYVFLGYSYMIANCSKSGEILHRLTDFPESISGIFFTFLFTGLISLGGTRATDHVNRWLTASVIGLLIAIEVLAIVFGGWSGFEGSFCDWQKVPATLPAMIFTLVYHDLAPVLCAYLGGDLTRIRASVLVGSTVPFLTFLVWEAVTLGLSNQADQVSDPVDLLLSVNWGGVPFLVQAFSLLAVGTSLIGTLLGFSEFFKEQLNNLSLDSPSEQLVEKQNSFYYIRTWWEKNKSRVIATAMVVAPSLLVSTTVPDAFSAATDIAGGYCMTMLYGVFPPAMAWAMHKKNGEENEQTSTISKLGPALVGVGLCATGILVEQILRDFSSLHII